jgi:hypothetical protein
MTVVAIPNILPNKPSQMGPMFGTSRRRRFRAASIFRLATRPGSFPAFHIFVSRFGTVFRHATASASRTMSTLAMGK